MHVAIAVVVILIVTCVVWFLLRKKRKERKERGDPSLLTRTLARVGVYRKELKPGYQPKPKDTPVGMPIPEVGSEVEKGSYPGTPHVDEGKFEPLQRTPTFPTPAFPTPVSSLLLEFLIPNVHPEQAVNIDPSRPPPAQ